MLQPLVEVNAIFWVGLGMQSCPAFNIGHITSLITETCGPQHLTFPGTPTWLLTCLLAFSASAVDPLFTTLSFLPSLSKAVLKLFHYFLFNCEAANYLAMFPCSQFGLPTAPLTLQSPLYCCLCCFFLCVAFGVRTMKRSQLKTTRVSKPHGASCLDTQEAA